MRRRNDRPRHRGARVIGTTIDIFDDRIAEAAGFFGFPYYLMGMTEVL